MSEATVDIIDVEPEAQRVPMHALLVGDKVFDIFGRPRRITDINVRRARGSSEPFIWIVRDDRPGHPEPLGYGEETITIIPSFAARAELTETQEV